MAALRPCHSLGPRARARTRRCLGLLALAALAALWASSGPPEGAAAPAPALSLAGLSLGALKVVGVLLVVVLAAVAAVVFAGGPLIAQAVKAYIEAFDQSILGVNVTIKSLEVRVYTGLVDIRGLVVSNAPGYSAEYLVNVDRATVDLNMFRLLRSGFRRIAVQRLTLSNVDVIWEKSGLTHSNVKEVLEFLRSKSEKGDAPQPTASAEQQDKEAQPKKRVKREVQLGTVKIEDVGVKMASHILHGAGVRLAVADIDYPNFSAEHGSYLGDDVAKILLASLLKTVVANTAGKSIGDMCF
uniref:AsmA domain-containing protein n=1 Tax=Pyrodinium bahamense TaxID=73915 RepID=A0A7S0A4F8_9DINO